MKSIQMTALVFEISIENQDKWEQFLFMHGKRLYDGIYKYCGHYYFECFDMWFRADTSLIDEDFDPLALAKAFGREYNTKALYPINYFEYGDGLWAYKTHDVLDCCIRQ